MKKIIFLILLLSISIYGCKKSVSLNDTLDINVTFELTILNGGNYKPISPYEFQLVGDTIFEKTKARLKVDSQDIAILDTFKNDTNYIWYMANKTPDSVIRFISDKEFNILNHKKLEREEIITELKYLKNEPQ